MVHTMKTKEIIRYLSLMLLTLGIAGMVACEKGFEYRYFEMTWTKIADSYYTGEPIEIELASELRCDISIFIDGSEEPACSVRNDNVLRLMIEDLPVGEHYVEYYVKYDGIEKTGKHAFFVVERPKPIPEPQIFDYSPVTKAYKDDNSTINVVADNDSQITLYIDGEVEMTVMARLVFDVSQLSVKKHKIKITAENATGKWETEFECEILAAQQSK